MSLFDRFKRRVAQQGAQQKASAKRERRPTETKELTIREEHASEAQKTKTSVEASTMSMLSHRVLLKPVISEKSTMLHGMNQYVFKISPLANRVMVKQAVFETYRVKPQAVRIVRVQGKEIRRGNIRGRRAVYKKAIVVMPKGVTLPIYEGV